MALSYRIKAAGRRWPAAFLVRLRRMTMVCLPLMLAACGFHPLYGENNSSDPAVLNELASIHVEPLRDRQGQLIHNALLTNLSPHGEPAHPRYRLLMRYTVTEAQQALRRDDTATRNVVFYSVAYYLYEGSTAVTAGTLNQVYSYDFLQAHYADISSEEDIQRRSAAAIAGELRNRLAAYFAKAAEVRKYPEQRP